MAASHYVDYRNEGRYGLAGACGAVRQRGRPGYVAGGLQDLTAGTRSLDRRIMAELHTSATLVGVDCHEASIAQASIAQASETAAAGLADRVSFQVAARRA